MKGLIVIGYQGIGKSSLAGWYNCVDLESSNFYINGKKDEKWYEVYCNIALDIANQGFVVFTSSHKEVRNYFHQFLNNLPRNIGNIVIFCPQVLQEKDWIDRLQERYNKTKTEKDKRALDRAIERYEEDIYNLTHSGFVYYQPKTVNYDLKNYIEKMREQWCL
ncbi:MAG: hypothetical protein IKF91_03060 [Bacilli bacterium]|nr:hypothetical protein [Bacilli bacterium]